MGPLHKNGSSNENIVNVEHGIFIHVLLNFSKILSFFRDKSMACLLCSLQTIETMLMVSEYYPSEDHPSEDYPSEDHPSDRPSWPCPSCGKRYYWKSNLTRHVKVECGKVPQWSCPTCGQRFKYKSHMLRHLNKMHGQ